MIDEGIPCAWPHIIIAVDHAAALQLIIHTCCSYVMWLDTLHWRNVLTWNIVTSLNDITGATVRTNVHRRAWLHGTRLLDKFVYIHLQPVLCDPSLMLPNRTSTSSTPTTIIHNHPRLHFQHQHPSVYNYIDCSSAVGLDSIVLRAMLVLL